MPVEVPLTAPPRVQVARDLLRDVFFTEKAPAGSQCRGVHGMHFVGANKNFSMQKSPADISRYLREKSQISRCGRKISRSGKFFTCFAGESR